MPTFFPRTTTEFHLEEPKAFRKFSSSLVEMAIVTGILLRLYRVVVLTHALNNWLLFGLTVALGTVFLLGAVTAHLANFTLRQYMWRAPLFALIEVAAEMATSAALIALGHERNGSVPAHWDDWLGMSLRALLVRGLPIVIWGLALAGVVQLVRRTIVHEEDEPEEVPSK
jgi:hypothetical protein